MKKLNIDDSDDSRFAYFKFIAGKNKVFIEQGKINCVYLSFFLRFG